MILEFAMLPIGPEQDTDFMTAFQRAKALVAATPGFIDLELRRCLEKLVKNVTAQQ